jgi:hydroxyacylglutathione hydrolase
MPLEIVTVPCLSDNYAYLLRDAATGTVGLVDAPEAGPIAAALNERSWRLDLILITHHHPDHIQAVDALRGDAKVVGAAADRGRLPKLDIAVAPGDTVRLGESAAEVFDAPGHTIGHIAYYFPEAGALFSADSLMVMGCGRLFEGTAEQMWQTLSRLSALPDDTLVYSGHEYAASNARFALSVDADNVALKARASEIAAMREKGIATVPARMDLERATNPFLRSSDPAFKARLGLENSPDAQVFAEVRRRKDAF